MSSSMGKNVITYTVATFVASLLVYFIYPLLPAEETVLDWFLFIFILLFVHPVVLFFCIVFEGLFGFVKGLDQLNDTVWEFLSNYSGALVLFIFCFGLTQVACDCLYSSFIKKEPTTTTTQSTTTTPTE